MLETLTERKQFGKWLTEHKLTGQAVEVGALSGGNARDWISTWPGRLVLVDLWIPQDPKIYREEQDKTNFYDCKKECDRLAAEYSPRVTLLQMDSVKASYMFSDGWLDAVYIDANHSYEAVMADMNAWWPKVKSGGVFCGHDAYIDTQWPSFCEVGRAVADWKRTHPEHKEFRTTKTCTSWWFIKA